MSHLIMSLSLVAVSKENFTARHDMSVNTQLTLGWHSLDTKVRVYSYPVENWLSVSCCISLCTSQPIYQPAIHWDLTQYWPTINRPSTKRRPSINQVSIEQLSVDLPLTKCQLTDDRHADQHISWVSTNSQPIYRPIYSFALQTVHGWIHINSPNVLQVTARLFAKQNFPLPSMRHMW